MSTRVLGAAAVFAGLCWGVLAIVVAVMGWRSIQLFDAIMSITGFVSTVAFAVVLVGLAIQFQDQLTSRAPLAAALAASGALLLAMGAHPMIVLFPLGSAIVVWDLARIGIVPRQLAIAHVASALGLLGLLVAMVVDYRVVFSGANPIVALATIPYSLTWIGIGGVLRPGVLRPEPRSVATSG
jgi:hypothetical protein